MSGWSESVRVCRKVAVFVWPLTKQAAWAVKQQSSPSHYRQQQQQKGHKDILNNIVYHGKQKGVHVLYMLCSQTAIILPDMERELKITLGS